MEMEDDLFFADFSKQISLLIMDEEGDHDDTALAPPPWHSYPLQDLYYVPRQQHLHQQQQKPRLMQELEKKNHQGPREIISKGTGVFIPRFAQPRRNRGTNHHHSTRHGSSFSDNYARSNHHYRQQQQQKQQQQQQLHDYSTRRLHQEDSKANYFR